jgi:hypothetical protein
MRRKSGLSLRLLLSASLTWASQKALAPFSASVSRSQSKEPPTATAARPLTLAGPSQSVPQAPLSNQQWESGLGGWEFGTGSVGVGGLHGLW